MVLNTESLHLKVGRSVSPALRLSFQSPSVRLHKSPQLECLRDVAPVPDKMLFFQKSFQGCKDMSYPLL